MPSYEDQTRWRKRAAGYSVQLSEADMAVLDAIAIELYEKHPHDPRRGLVSEVFPGRPAAIRWLIADYTKKHGKPKARPGLARRARERLARFWQREACWRRTRDPDTSATPPPPPWR